MAQPPLAHGGLWSLYGEHGFREASTPNLEFGKQRHSSLRPSPASAVAPGASKPILQVYGAWIYITASVHPMYFVQQAGSQAVPISSEEIYHSANGDRWHLIRDAASERIFVRHEANRSSGGFVTDIDVADFLNVGGAGPEYATLRDIMRRRKLASPIADRIKTIVANHLKLADSVITPEASFIDDPGADGVDVVEIVMALEDAFGLKMPEDVAERIHFVKDVIDYVETRNAGG